MREVEEWRVREEEWRDEGREEGERVGWAGRVREKGGREGMDERVKERV